MSLEDLNGQVAVGHPDEHRPQGKAGLIPAQAEHECATSRNCHRTCRDYRIRPGHRPASYVALEANYYWVWTQRDEVALAVCRSVADLPGPRVCGRYPLPADGVRNHLRPQGQPPASSA
jgi:hypothetical protein